MLHGGVRGATGFLVYVATVHPQLATAWFTMSGAVPVFLNVNTWVCSFDSGNVPKLKVVASKLILASLWAKAVATSANNIIVVNNSFLISLNVFIVK